jgi:hypothetical protein
MEDVLVERLELLAAEMPVELLPDEQVLWRCAICR